MTLRRLAGHLLLVLLLIAGSVPAQATVIFVPIFIPQVMILPGATTADYQDIHTVAVISSLGTKLIFMNDHFFAASKDRDITSWKLDDEIAAHLKQYLSARFTFRDVPYDRAALANIPNGPMNNSLPELAKFIQGVPSDGIDAFIVVRPDLERQAPGAEGLELHNNEPLGRDVAPVLWANYEIDVVNAHSGKMIARAYSRLRLKGNTPPSFAGMVVGDDLKVGDDFALDEKQEALLRADASFLINASLVETLRVMELGAVLPPPGTRTLVPIPPDKNPYRTYSRVAVVSGLGDQLALEKLAPFLVHNKYQVPDGWHMDALVEERLKAQLEKHFQIAQPNVDRAAFAAARLWDDSGKEAPSFPGLNASPDVDLYVVVVPLNRGTLGNGNTFLGDLKNKGLGVFRASTVDSASTILFAHFALVVIDAHTMKVLVGRSGLLSPDHVRADPQTDLGDASWPKSPASPTPDEIAKWHDPMVEMLDDALDETLLQLNLLGVAPVDGSQQAPTSPPDSSNGGTGVL